jgi:hypothetical protein
LATIDGELASSDPLADSPSLPKFNSRPRIRIAYQRNERRYAYGLKTNGGKRMLWKSLTVWRQKRTLRQMLNDPRAARGFRSVGQLEKAIAADRKTTERLLQSIGARKSHTAEEWTLAANET